MLLPRVLTALALLAVLVGTLIAESQFWFETFILVFCGAALWEWLRLCGIASGRAVLMALGFLPLCWYVWHAGSLRAHQGLLFGSGVLWMAYGFPLLRRGLPPLQDRAHRWLLSVFGVWTVTAAFVAILLAMQRGPLFCVSLLSIVWIADIGAYAFGRTLGKHKLAPSISPGKTWEGAAGGLFCAVLFAVIGLALPTQWAHQSYVHALVERLDPWGAGLMLGVLVAMSIGGDLFESMLKRRIGMKDSSRLLPGHGGVLDRVDALLPVLPIAMGILV